MENSCCYAGLEPLTAHALRVHTHELGRRALSHRYAGIEALHNTLSMPGLIAVRMGNWASQLSRTNLQMACQRRRIWRVKVRCGGSAAGGEATDGARRSVMVHRAGPGGDGVLAVRDPREPKGFGAMDPPAVLHPGDRLTTTCTFDTTSREVGRPSMLPARSFLAIRMRRRVC